MRKGAKNSGFCERLAGLGHVPSTLRWHSCLVGLQKRLLSQEVTGQFLFIDAR
jgi:hypothetical protein